MPLNPLQQSALEAVIHGPDQIITLTGEGGSGKTFTTQAILQAYTGTFTLTATTHRAKEVLSQQCLAQAITTQSATGFVLVRKQYRQVLEQVSDYFATQLLIVDELSMLPQSIYKVILADLASHPNHKVLFLGDRVQLPAIEKGVDIDSIPGKHITLTQQHRQQNSSPALQSYLADLRTAILTGGEAPSLRDIPEITVMESHREFCRTYLDTPGCKKVVAYRNAVVEKYNHYINGKADRYNPGDDVIIDGPVINNEIIYARNGATIHITDVQPHPKLAFDIITATTAEGAVVTVHAWHTPTALKQFLEPLKGKPNSRYWEYHELAVGLKHTYACTVHKTQGSTYNTVFLDATDLWAAYTAIPNKYNNPISFEMFLRLQYVAISRMQSHCYLYIGNSRHYPTLKETNAD